jgi:nitrogen fixation/metabolism regulation signal transduction histidine kinase
MIYKKYYINIFIRILLILINCLLFSFVLLNSNYLYTIVFLGILILFQSFLLIKYINQSNIFLERFLNYIKESNTTIEFAGSLEDTPFKDLTYYFTEINKIIQDAKIEKENQYQFLQYIFDHVNIGLIAFDGNQKVLLINTAAKNLFGIKNLSNIRLIDKFNQKLHKTILNLNPGDQKILPAIIKGKNLQLSIKLSKFKLLDREVSLISLQDIKPELDHKEIESWQKLNRVLTHEIMNSVSPIIGLTSNVSKLLKKDNKVKNMDNLNSEIIEQTVQSINIIEERSIGLNNFVNKFRSITASIKPEPKNISVFELFEDLSLFMHDTFEKNEIKFMYTVEPENLELFVDRKLLEQVLINLLKNSTEAFGIGNNKIIKLCAKLNETNQKIIEVIDTGCGISEDKIDLIFTPFYTSKETGSGVGLSLSRNILKQHGYNIDVRSIPNSETVFTLYF